MAKFNPTITAYLVLYVREGNDIKKSCYLVSLLAKVEHLFYLFIFLHLVIPWTSGYTHLPEGCRPEGKRIYIYIYIYIRQSTHTHGITMHYIYIWITMVTSCPWYICGKSGLITYLKASRNASFRYLMC